MNAELSPLAEAALLSAISSCLKLQPRHEIGAPEHRALTAALELLPLAADAPASALSPLTLLELDQPASTPQVLAPGSARPEAIFPFPKDRVSVGRLQAHLHRAGEALRAVLAAGAPGPDRLARLLGVIDEHLWCVAGATPGSSLADDARALAAAACAIHRSGSAGPDAPLAVVVGDLSGIQRYIFGSAQVGAGGVARRLRARSFRLSLVQEAAAWRILRRLGLPSVNLLMNAGGRFVILAPGHPEALQALADEADALAADFWTGYGGHVALNVGWAEFPAGDLRRFGQVMAAAETALSRAKSRPLAGALQLGGRWEPDAFLAPAPGAGAEPCHACGRELVEPGEEQCRSCHLDARLGSLLPRAESIAIYTREVQGGMPLLGDWQFQVGRPGAPLAPDALAVLALRDDGAEAAVGPQYRRDLMAHIPLGPVEMDGFCGRCPLCDQAERDRVQPGNPLYFDCLAVHGEGRPLLGYLKADVDRLGSLFVVGLEPPEGERRVTPGQIAALSRLLERFFAGHVNRLLAAEFPLCYAIFAGGDDLFVAGPWADIFRLAQRVQADFRRLTGENPNVTLSAGVALAPHRAPVSRTAAQAEEALERAKEEPAPGATGSRDQLACFGGSIKWADVDKVLTEGRRLGEWLNGPQPPLGRGFVHRLLEYGEMLGQFREGREQGMPVLALLTYDFERNLPDRGPVREWADRLREGAWKAATGVQNGADVTLALHLRAAAGYALNLYRKGEWRAE